MTTRHNARHRIVAALAVAVTAVLGGVMLMASNPSPSPAAAATSHRGDDHSRGEHNRDEHDRSGHHHRGSATAETQLYTTMRSLWDQHMEWTWSTVVAFATDSPAFSPTVERLLQNQADIGNAIAAHYGTEAGDQLTALLKTHITDAVPVLQAAKAGDQVALGKALDEWYANAQQIADFLSSANPRNWDRDAMREMMETHITQTTAYAGAALAGDYPSAIAKYDEAQAHMSDMADMLSAGIIAQFPRQFRG